MKSKKKNHDLIKIFTWIFFVVVVVVLYQFKREMFDVSFLQSFVIDNKFIVVLVYLFILSILGLFFIPSTPFAIAGVALFSPVEAYVLNLVGILTSSMIVYYFAQYIGLDRQIKKRYPQQKKRVKKALKNMELPIIAGWSLVPIVPTDLIIYVASSLKIPFKKCVLGVLLGEGTLNAIYIFALGSIL